MKIYMVSLLHRATINKTSCMSFRLVPKSVTLNGVMALILRDFTEFSSFRGALHKSGWRCRRKKVHVRCAISWRVSCYICAVNYEMTGQYPDQLRHKQDLIDMDLLESKALSSPPPTRPPPRALWTTISGSSAGVIAGQRQVPANHVTSALRHLVVKCQQLLTSRVKMAANKLRTAADMKPVVRVTAWTISFNLI